MGIHDGHREKMRRRFQKNDLKDFAEHEALELLLYYAIPRRDTNPIAHALIDKYGSLAAVLSAPVEDLQKEPGIGENAATLLRLAGQIGPMARILESEKGTPMTSVEAVGSYLLDRFAGEKNEVLYQLCLDRKGKLLTCKCISEGGTASTDLDLRKMVENALLSSASIVILAHNHPSGVALPSDDDYTATRWAQNALQTIGVTLADHIIVADGDYVSLRDSGFFDA